MPSIDHPNATGAITKYQQSIARSRAGDLARFGQLHQLVVAIGENWFLEEIETPPLGTQNVNNKTLTSQNANQTILPVGKPFSRHGPCRQNLLDFINKTLILKKAFNIVCCYHQHDGDIWHVTQWTSPPPDHNNSVCGGALHKGRYHCLVQWTTMLMMIRFT